MSALDSLLVRPQLDGVWPMTSLQLPEIWRQVNMDARAKQYGLEQRPRMLGAIICTVTLTVPAYGIQFCAPEY